MEGAQRAITYLGEVGERAVRPAPADLSQIDGRLATSAWDQKTAFAEGTPGTVEPEAAVLRWLIEATGLSNGSSGAYVTGTTVVNMVTLATACVSIVADIGWDAIPRVDPPSIVWVQTGNVNTGAVDPWIIRGRSRHSAGPPADGRRLPAW